jgi:hypothetical protein
MTFEALLKVHDDAEAQAAARKSAVDVARRKLAEAEAEVSAKVAAARRSLAEAEAAVVQAAEAVAVAREAVHVRLKEKGQHSLRGKGGAVTVYRATPDHGFEAFQPTPGD